MPSRRKRAARPPAARQGRTSAAASSGRGTNVGADPVVNINGDGGTKKTAKQLSVLFMHGLESGPHGRKSRYLKEHCEDMLAPDMEISALSLKKKRSIARQVLAQRRVQVILFLIALSVVLICIPKIFLWPYPSIVALLVALYIADRDRVLITQTAVRASIDGCVEVMGDAIKRFEPDVVVGSSWGGAVATCCLEAGVWSGPTVLLAPAYQRVVTAMGGTYRDGLPYITRGLVVVHSRKDRTIDYRDSRKLVRALGASPGIILIEVLGDDHRLNSLVHPVNGKLASLVEDVYHSYWHGNVTDHGGNPQMAEYDTDEQGGDDYEEENGDGDGGIEGDDDRSDEGWEES